jgi:hypothetical protein
MNTHRVAVASLVCIVLAFIIKGYYILQQVAAANQTAFDCEVETLKQFLYLFSVFVAVIVWPFVFKIKV